MVTPERRGDTNAVVAKLKTLLGDRLSTAPAVRQQHGKDQTWNPGLPPDAVAFGRSTAEVAAIVKTCAAHDVPVIAYGTGTSLEGHFAAVQGGVCIDLSQMDRIIAVNAEDLDCRVEAGVTRKALNAHLRDQGLFFPIDPGADASLGGMAATRASGTNAVRYGTMRDNVLGLTVVMADGTVIETGGRARKSAAGYDLTRLFVGSEGTLGIITEVGLRLSGIPEAVAAGVCPFPTVEACAHATIQTIQLGLPVARIELLDADYVEAVNAYSKLDLAPVPTLFVEFHGSAAGVAEQAETFNAIAADLGGGPFVWATREEDRAKLWAARHDAFWAAKAHRPGMEVVISDVCVPISRLADCIAETRADMQEHQIFAPLVGHVGDGNFHLIMFFRDGDAAELDRLKAAYDRLIRRAIAMGGTATGEHGVGLGKRKYLDLEHGPAVSVMRRVKQALDPQNLLNPGKNAGP